MPTVLGVVGTAVALAAAVVIPAGAATTPAAGTGPVTVAAPGAGAGASVTVSRTADLVNQSVNVSWKGFQPSSDTVLHRFGGSYDVNTLRPVRVYECRGANPTSSSDCYGSTGYDGVPDSPGHPGVAAVPGFTYSGQTSSNAVTPDGPGNAQDTVTAADGTGQAVIQIFTGRESASLGCDATTPCSLVVVPNYGPDAPPGDATEPSLDAPWAWARRTVVPLSFLPVANACPLTSPDVTTEGAPVSARSVLSWRAGACTLPNKQATVIDYTSVPEPQARQDFVSGASDVGLTEQPLEAGLAATAPPFAYVPVSVSGIVAAFQIDDAHGQPVTSMRLNARLVAKIITASYFVGSDPNVAGNPRSLFSDPEFLALNADEHVDWPDDVGNQPLLLAGDSDVTWALTRWVNADPTARAFLDGTPDESGMRVNDAYKGVALPVRNFPLLDAAQNNNFVPVQGLEALGRQLSLGKLSSVDVTTDPATGLAVVAKSPAQSPGQHRILGFISSSDAAAFLLPTAQLQTRGGGFVAPTSASLSAALDHMTVNPDGVTRDFDLATTDAAAYPLTVVTQALVRTQPPAAKAAKLAAFLSYVSDTGQVPGFALGRLPDGFAPLSPALKAQATMVIAGLKARGGVVTASPSSGHASPGPSPSAAAASSSAPVVEAAPSLAPASGAPSGPAPVVAPVEDVGVAPQALSLQSRRLGLAQDAAPQGVAVLPLLLLIGIVSAGAAGWLGLRARRAVRT